MYSHSLANEYWMQVAGPAGVFMILDQQKVTALDPLLDAYAEKLDQFAPTAYPYIQFENQSLEKFQAGQAFDKVFCFNAINHVADLAKAMDVLVDSCRPGGQLIISIDAHNYSLLKKIFRLLPGDILHPHQHDLADYEQLLETRSCRIYNSILYKKAFIFNYYILVATKAVNPS